MSKLPELLKNIYLFRELTPAEVEKLAALAEEKHYASGDSIFYEGDPADAMFVIGVGTVGLIARSEDDEELGLLGSGAHFGELPFLDGMHRQLTVRCKEPSTIYRIPFDKLKVLLEADNGIAADFYKAIAHFLSARLRKTDSELVFIREHSHHRRH